MLRYLLVFIFYSFPTLSFSLNVYDFSTSPLAPSDATAINVNATVCDGGSPSFQYYELLPSTIENDNVTFNIIVVKPAVQFSVANCGLISLDLGRLEAGLYNINYFNENQDIFYSTSFTVQGIKPIPSLSGYAMLIMIILFTLVVWLRLRRVYQQV